MKVLFAHAFYRDMGGEDVSVLQEAEALKNAGMRVETFFQNNADISAARLALQPWLASLNPDACRRLRAKVQTFRPDVIHFHNTWFGLSSHAVSSLADLKIPIVVTLHNYRIGCINGYMYRNEQSCSLCVDSSLGRFNGILHGCFTGSRAKSAINTMASGYLRRILNRPNLVSGILVPSQQAADQLRPFLTGQDRIGIKPNVIFPFPAATEEKENYYLYVGRLGVEKGIRVVLSAWEKMKVPPRLKIIGQGPDEERVKEVCQKKAQVEWLGPLPIAETAAVMAKARALVFPSIWNETFGRTLVEALAMGTPIIGSNITAVRDVISDGVNGRLFPKADDTALAQTVQLHESCNRRPMMNQAAAEMAHQRFAPDILVAQQTGFYHAAIERFHGSGQQVA